jgi:DNA-directed RNA polymerase subunit RPC12/RpoP
MATFEFTCRKCEGSFEIDAQDLVDGNEALECPHCNARLSKGAAEDFTSAVAEFLAQLAAISKKFTATVEFDSDSIGETDDEEDDEDEDDDLDDDEDDDLDEDEDEDDDLDEDEDLDDDR